MNCTLTKYWQGCKIPLARSHLRVKRYAGRVKVLTIFVVLSYLQHLRDKFGAWRASNLFGNFTPLIG